MTQTISAEQLTLYDLISKFGLKQVDDSQFFGEWQTELPGLTASEKQQLDRVKANYLNLSIRPLLEDMVKMVVLSPLLDLAGFYSEPFYTIGEQAIAIELKDDDQIIKGKIDVLVLLDQLWVLVIESKRASFSLEIGIPQALTYMLAHPCDQHSAYGLVTNGSNFIFLKLLKQPQPQYALSDEFTLRRGNDLYTVLAILKQLNRIFIQERSSSALV